MKKLLTVLLVGTLISMSGCCNPVTTEMPAPKPAP